jgi:hypothetical protein
VTLGRAGNTQEAVEHLRWSSANAEPSAFFEQVVAAAELRLLEGKMATKP